MSFLTDQELTEIRAEVEKVLPDTCTIQTETLTSDGGGGGTVSWTDAATSVACKLVAKTAGVADLEGGRINYHTDWLVRLPYDQSVAVGQRIVIGGDNYEVMSVEDDHSWRALRSAYCRRTK